RLEPIHPSIVIPNYESPTEYASLAIIDILPRVHIVRTWHTYTSWKLRSIAEHRGQSSRKRESVRESAADRFSVDRYT
ncbi:hypothetical protein ALC62_09452, partial [Cyphomyrmex costatus]